MVTGFFMKLHWLFPHSGYCGCRKAEEAVVTNASYNFIVFIKTLTGTGIFI